MSESVNVYKDRYKKIEVTFNTYDDNEMNLYYFILQKSAYLGKSKYLKNIIRDIQAQEAKKTELG